MTMFELDIEVQMYTFTCFNSSSLATASRICLGVTLPFLLSLAALPASSRISAVSIVEN